MKQQAKWLFGLLLPMLSLSVFCQMKSPEQADHAAYIIYETDPRSGTLHFFWKNDLGENFTNHKVLQEWLQAKNQELVFAMNGGMYLEDLSPQGLYIENGETKSPLDRKQQGYGNFYLQPNGIFYLTKENVGGVCRTADFADNGNIKYATQSGPMLLIDGKINAKFNAQSKHLNIRNGVGIKADGNLVFAMSKGEVTLYDFADFFRKAGCKNALYLDGFVSRIYLPAQQLLQEDGTFGVIIGEVRKR